MLNAWEAGIKYLQHLDISEPKAIDIAKQLGWVREANQSR